MAAASLLLTIPPNPRPKFFSSSLRMTPPALHMLPAANPRVRWAPPAVSALASKVDLAEPEATEEPTVVAPHVKPKKGKAAFPLKSDRKLRESKKEYDLPTVVALMKEMASTKFTELTEAHFRLNIDPKYND